MFRISRMFRMLQMSRMFDIQFISAMNSPKFPLALATGPSIFLLGKPYLLLSSDLKIDIPTLKMKLNHLNNTEMRHLVNASHS